MIARIVLVLAVIGLFGCSGAINSNDDLNHDGIVSIDEQVQYFIRNEQLTDIKGYTFSTQYYSPKYIYTTVSILKNNGYETDIYYYLDDYKNYEKNKITNWIDDDVSTIPLNHHLFSQHTIKSLIEHSNASTNHQEDVNYSVIDIQGTNNQTELRYGLIVDHQTITYTCYTLDNNSEFKSQQCR